MDNTEKVIQGSLALSTLILRLMEAQQRSNELLSTIHREAREPTVAEVESVQADRKRAVQRAHELT